MEDKFKINHQLEQKYQTNEQFRSQMNEKSIYYKSCKAALAIQKDLKITEDLLEVFALQNDYDTFFYYAFLQPKSKQMTAQLALFLIKNFNPRFHKKYKFVFFNNQVDGNQIYYEFKKIFLTLPIEYFIALDQFIFIKPSISQKFTHWWASQELEQYFNAKIKYLSSITELCSLLNVNLQRIIQCLPLKIVEKEFPEWYLSMSKKSKELASFRINLTGQSRSMQQQQNYDNFLMAMSNFFQNSKNQALQIEEYQATETKIPVILEQLVQYFNQHQQGLKQQGIFRKSVSIDEQNETLQELLKSNFQCLKNITNSHLIASLIKRFFAKLKTPIFPYQSFQKLMHDQGITNKLDLIKTQISSLPPKNYFPLMFLFQFLIKVVLPYEKYTKMNSQNLAICFAPCLLKSQKPSELDLIYATKSSFVVKLIIDNFEEVFGPKLQRQKRIREIVEQQRNKWSQNLMLNIKRLSSSSCKQQKDFFSI